MMSDLEPSRQAPLLLAAISDTALRLSVLDGLAAHGWRVMTASAGEEIPALIVQHAPDGLLVDPPLADRSASIIRSLPMLRVALIPRDETETGITLMRALKINACLELPLNMAYLAATLDGLLRLSKPAAGEEGNLMKPRGGDEPMAWTLSRTTWLLAPQGASAVQLNQAETTFLATLAENPGAPVSRPQMIAALGHNVDYYDSRRLDTLVSRLRLKVQRDSGQPLPVRSIHSVGYAVVAQIILED